MRYVNVTLILFLFIFSIPLSFGQFGESNFIKQSPYTGVAVADYDDLGEGFYYLPRDYENFYSINFNYLNSQNSFESIEITGLVPNDYFFSPEVRSIVSVYVDGQNNNQFLYTAALFQYIEEEDIYISSDEISCTIDGEPTLLFDNYSGDIITAGDLDNDGDEDVLYTFDCCNYKWIENTNQGETWQINNLNIEWSNRKAILFDFNEDGHTDIITQYSYIDDIALANKIVAYPNDGNQNFNSDTVILHEFEGNQPISVEDLTNTELQLIDLNNDSRKDLVFSYKNGTNIHFSWLENLGNGNFSPEKSLFVDTQYYNDYDKYEIELSDMNLDGFIDVIIGRSKRNSSNAGANLNYGIQVLLNNGNAEWESFFNLTDIKCPFTVMDVNGDQYPDIIGNHYNSTTFINHTVWQENKFVDSLTYLKGKIYNDINENGVYDQAIDLLIPNATLTLQPGNLIYSSDDEGNYNITVPNTGNYSLTVSQPLILNCDFTALVPSQFGEPTTGTIDFTFDNYLQIEQDFGLVNANSDCNQISGNVSHDFNSNGTVEINEYGVVGALVKTANQSVFTDLNGDYSFDFSSNQNIEVSIDTFNNLVSYCNSSVSYSQTFPTNPNSYSVSTNSSHSDLDFGLVFSDFIDLGISNLSVYNGNVASDTFNVWLGIKSYGQIEVPCTLRIDHDPLVSFINSSITPTNVSNDFVEWIFPVGTAPIFNCILMNWYLDSAAVAGSTLHWEANYTCSPAVDICTYNNTIIRDVEVIEGPVLRPLEILEQNMYSMRPEGIMPEYLSLTDTVLSFVIDFQNHTSKYVNNLVIIDTLPTEVIPNSISRPFSSHEYKFRLIEPNIAIWEFENINLSPIEDNELNSYGFVQFNVNLQSNLPGGTIILNQANLLFNKTVWDTTNEVIHIIQGIANEPPTAICNENIIVYLDETGNASITPELIDGGSTDDIGIESLEVNQTDFDCSDLGDFNIELVAFDEEGNSDTCFTDISIVDTLLPTISCADIDIVIASGETYSIEDDVANFETNDNCSEVTTTVSQTTFSETEEGTNTTTIYIGDESGNIDSCYISVNVEIVTAILESKYDIEISIAPNPMQNYTVLTFSKSLPFSYNVSIFNVKGQNMLQLENLNETSLKIENNNLSRGMYLIKLTDSNTQIELGTYKLIVE